MTLPTSRCGRVVGAIITAVLLFASLCGSGVRAALDPVAQQQVESSVVELALWLVGAKHGQPLEETQPRGSGTIISADGLILTNAHVITTQGLPDEIAARTAQAAQQGSDLTLAAAADADGALYYRVLIPDQSGNPVPAYTAQVVGVDPILDLAVLRVVGDAYGGPLGERPLPLAPVTLGDSDQVQRAQPVHIFGYPAGLGLLYTEGTVSGYAAEPGVVGRAWIYTNAKVAAGNSGGAAVDDAGRLIGIPTAVLPPECRPDATDEGQACQPTGDSFAQLRPINLARPLLKQVASDLGLPAPPTPPASTTPPPAATAAVSPAPTVTSDAPSFVAGDTAPSLAGGVIRSAADPQAEIVDEVPPGTPLRLVRSQRAADGSTWWLVTNLTNLTASGYIEARFLAGAGSSPAVAAPGASPTPAAGATAPATSVAEATCAVPEMFDSPLGLRFPIGTLNTTVTVVNAGGTGRGLEQTLPAGTRVILDWTYRRVYGVMMFQVHDLAEDNQFWIAAQDLDYATFDPAEPACAIGSMVLVDPSAPDTDQPAGTTYGTFADAHPGSTDIVGFISGPAAVQNGMTWWPVREPAVLRSDAYVPQEYLKPALFPGEGPSPPATAPPAAEPSTVVTWPTIATFTSDAHLYDSPYLLDPDVAPNPVADVSAGTPVTMFSYQRRDNGDIYWDVLIRGTAAGDHATWARDQDLAYRRFDPAAPQANLGAYALVDSPYAVRVRPDNVADSNVHFDDGDNPGRPVVVIISGPPEQVDGETWWPVMEASVSAGSTGYVLEQNLGPIRTSTDATPAPATPPSG